MIEAAEGPLPKDNMTWDELMDYGRELKAKLPEGSHPSWITALIRRTTSAISTLSRVPGYGLWTTAAKSYATVESARKWLQMWADMRAEGLIPDADTTATYAESGAD